VDPGGSGLRYCIERYIPAEDFCYWIIGCGNGDNRGTDPAGGSFKSQTLIFQSAAGQWATTNTAGYSQLTGGLFSLGPYQGTMNCSFFKSKVLGETYLSSNCSAVNGIDSALGVIRTDVTIAHTATGGVVWSAYGTLFPNAEIWMYGAPEGPTLLLDFQTPYTEPFSGLNNTGNLMPGS
jgi:hypothetical protein